MERTVAARLEEARARRFVGRATERAVLREALRSPEPPFTVLYVHGPGGVGKSALLGAFAGIATEAGAVPVRVDGRALDLSPESFAAAMDLPAESRAVLLVDTYEAIAALDGWIREVLIPGLRSDTIVVIAGRNPPSPGWSADPGWRDLLHTLKLENLTPEEIEAYAKAAGLEPRKHERLAAVTHGHPLALVLLTDLLRRDPNGGDDLTGSPDLVTRLAQCFIADAPGERHRRALQACAHARFTTEPLLRAALGGTVEDVFAWLCGLPFIERGELGVFPHDLVRDVISADLRWRDPQTFTDLHRGIRAHLLDRVNVTTGRQQARWITDASFLARTHPVIRPFWDWDTLGAAYADRVTPEDHAAILDMTARHENAETAAIIARYLDHPAAQVFAFRAGAREPQGFGVLLRLDEMSAADLTADPATAAAWAHVTSHGPLAPGEQVAMGRALIDRDHYQGPSASRNVASAMHTQRILRNPDLAFDFIASLRDGEHHAPVMEHIGYHRLPEADYRIGDAHFTVYARDWRGRTPQSWVAMLGDRDLGLTEPADEQPTHSSYEDITAAVRAALRDLHAPERLATNPLMRLRQVTSADPTTLQTILRTLIAEIGATPRHERLHLALDRTYLHPAPTQERAAETLNLSLSTYRRHLTAAITLLTDLLWARERDTTLNHP
ncbi:ATP-binding protein [Thermomonospora umbrina]|uniref:Orc1-like AAA ATPase domain-containing protein n=1 Tax=Thermomonospora umbrina TaxID=111806 RepID=A0A3D9SJ55_9ACTN|nr:ATP-binding protein [Thermomonospora umbrina]REE95952.1 hypothetical protein DFJ69_1369 [Thermomonospora umbrina]